MRQRHVLMLLFPLCVLLTVDIFSGAVCGKGYHATIWLGKCEVLLLTSPDPQDIRLGRVMMLHWSFQSAYAILG